MGNTNYIIVKTELGKERAVLGEIMNLPKVEAHLCEGLYDIFAKVETADLNELSDIMKYKIGSIRGVVSARSLIAQTDDHGALVGQTKDGKGGFSYRHPSLE